MTLEELVSAVAKETGMTKANANKAVHAVLHAIENALARGERVAIAGFGVFEVTQRAARKGRNPRTGETIEIPPTKAVRFRPGKTLRDAVNK